MNDQSSHVLKCSSDNYYAKDGYLQPTKKLSADSVCLHYVDTMYYRCKSYKMLILQIYNPLVCKVQHMATVEVKNENTENIVIFWTFFMMCQQK